jgi:membrane protein involved in colicin uptake
MGQIADRLKRQRGGTVESGHQGDKGFRERLNAAAEAKKALLEKFRAQAGPDDPAVIERQAAREAVSVARDVRVVERKAAREADAAQRDADAVRRQADAVREAAEQASRDAEQKAARDASAAALKAEQKATRDARYAARKKR